MKTALIISDFKPSSKKAVHFASEFVKRYHLNVVMLHVITPDSEKTPILVTTQVRNDKEAYFDKFSDQLGADTLHLLKDEHAGIDCVEYIVENVGVMPAINNLLDAKLIDLVVMTTHASDKNANTYTTEVLQNANCPILAVPDSIERFKLDNITFATTLKEDQMVAFYLLGKWQKIFHSEIDILYLNDPANLLSHVTLKEKVDEIALSHDMKINQIYTAVHSSNPLQQMEEFVNDNHTDMLAMVTHKRTGLAKFFQGSMTEKAISNVKVPVLSFEPAKLG